MSMKSTFIWLYVKTYECQSVMRDSFCPNVCIFSSEKCEVNVNWLSGYMWLYFIDQQKH